MANHFREKPVEEALVQERQEELRQRAEVAGATVAVGARDDDRPTAKPGLFFRVMGGDILNRKQVVRQVPLIVLILIYGILIVSMRYSVEGLMKEKIRITNELEYLREHRIMMQKSYQESIKISQVAERLEEIGVGVNAGPPYEI